jgi:uncharacterized protein YcbX
MTARVSWISFTPVKGLALEHVQETELLESGLRGDRRFYLVDANNRLVNNKGGRRGALQVVKARYDDASAELTLRLADGRELSGRATEGDELQTSIRGRSVLA